MENHIHERIEVVLAMEWMLRSFNGIADVIDSTEVSGFTLCPANVSEIVAHMEQFSLAYDKLYAALKTLGVLNLPSPDSSPGGPGMGVVLNSSTMIHETVSIIGDEEVRKYAISPNLYFRIKEHKSYLEAVINNAVTLIEQSNDDDLIENYKGVAVYTIKQVLDLNVADAERVYNFLVSVYIDDLQRREQNE